MQPQANGALLAYIQQSSMLEAVRQVVREELAPPRPKARSTCARQAAMLLMAKSTGRPVSFTNVYCHATDYGRGNGYVLK